MFIRHHSDFCGTVAMVVEVKNDSRWCTEDAQEQSMGCIPDGLSICMWYMEFGE